MEKVKEFFKSKLSFFVMIMKLEKENFYDVVRPLYNVAKLFGYSPFQLPKDTSWTSVQQRASPFDTLKSIFCFVLYLFLLYTQFGIEKFYSHSNFVIDVAEDILLTYLTCTSIISTTILLILRKQVWTIINDIASIDNKITALGICIPFKKHYKFVVLHITTFATLQIGAMIFTCVIQQKHYNPSMHSRFNCLQACFIYFYGIGAFSMTMSYYYLSLLAVYTRLRHVNRYIENIFTTAPDDDSKDIDRCLIVRQISKIYDGLCDIVETINFCFSFQVMALLAACFGFLVFCVFTLYKAIIAHPSNDNIYFRNLVLNLIWNCHYSIIAFTVIYSGSNLAYQGHKTGVLVHKAIYYVNDDKVIDKVTIF
uniref:Gustatory receptor n=1 Tax=Bradysia odoriphaga TaxID=1564500 RepID=A0A6B9C9K3_9DIPT|nr:gustatory receptor 2 [Bradysia odoriphaga]